MKVPPKIKTYCPKCRKHLEHDVKLDRKGKERGMNRGRRKYASVKAGYGGSPRTPKKPNYKIGKRPVIIITCSECKKKQQRIYAARSKKRAEVE